MHSAEHSSIHPPFPPAAVAAAREQRRGVGAATQNGNRRLFFFLCGGKNQQEQHALVHSGGFCLPLHFFQQFIVTIFFFIKVSGYLPLMFTFFFFLVIMRSIFIIAKVSFFMRPLMLKLKLTKENRSCIYLSTVDSVTLKYK